MSLTALQAILAALAIMNDNHPRYRVISKEPSDEACAIVAKEANGMTSKASYDGDKLTRYTCSGKYPWDKGFKVEYQIVDGGIEEDEDEDDDYVEPGVGDSNSLSSLRTEDVLRKIQEAQANIGEHSFDLEQLKEAEERLRNIQRQHYDERDDLGMILDDYTKNTENQEKAVHSDDAQKHS